jgi:hypothetical protein
MASVVHLKTVVQSVFGVVDDEGNVIREIVVGGAENQPIQIKVLSHDNWVGLFNGLQDAKQQLLDQANAQPEEEVPVVQGEIVD